MKNTHYCTILLVGRGATLSTSLSRDKVIVILESFRDDWKNFIRYGKRYVKALVDVLGDPAVAESLEGIWTQFRNVADADHARMYASEIQRHNAGKLGVLIDDILGKIAKRTELLDKFIEQIKKYYINHTIASELQRR